MKSGAILSEFTDNKGRRVTLRTPEWEDLDGLLELINSAVDERVDIYVDEPKTRDEEATWLGQILAKNELGKMLHVVALVDDAVVGSASLEKHKGCMGHTGELGVLIKGGFREAGIGTKVLSVLMGHAKEMGLEVLVIRYFSGNDRAEHVYRKIGFSETGRMPGAVKRDGRYRDLVILMRRVPDSPDDPRSRQGVE